MVKDVYVKKQKGGQQQGEEQKDERKGRGLLVTKWITYGLVGTDGVDLGAEHHRGEDEEEETLKAQEYEEDDCCWRREGTALWGIGGTWRKRSERAKKRAI